MQVSSIPHTATSSAYSILAFSEICICIPMLLPTVSMCRVQSILRTIFNSPGQALHSGSDGQSSKICSYHRQSDAYACRSGQCGSTSPILNTSLRNVIYKDLYHPPHWQQTGMGHLSTRKSVCHQPQLTLLTAAPLRLISHGLHSFSFTLHVPSWRNLFQPHVKAAPLSVRTAQCLAPLQTCRHTTSHQNITSVHVHAYHNCTYACIAGSHCHRIQAQGTHMTKQSRNMANWYLLHPV